jgi:hypothetical protein
MRECSGCFSTGGVSDISLPAGPTLPQFVALPHSKYYTTPLILSSDAARYHSMEYSVDNPTFTHARIAAALGKGCPLRLRGQSIRISSLDEPRYSHVRLYLHSRIIPLVVIRPQLVLIRRLLRTECTRTILRWVVGNHGGFS